jgi:hypothetical protein
MQRLTFAPLAALAAFLLLGAAAHAQTAGTITFNANQTSAQGGLTPVLTWSTSPVATSCQASGGWSGTKFALGTETLARITANKSYTLTCSWGSASTTVHWVAPTRNTDNSTLTDLASFKVVYGRSATDLSSSKAVSDPRATSTIVSGLTAGTWYFAVRAVNTAQRESAPSNVATRTITAASAAKTVNITITAAPTNPTPTPGLRTVSTTVYDVVWVNQVRTRGRAIGTIAIGKPCERGYQVGTNYFRVNRSDTRLTMEPRGASIIARCATS